MRRDRKRNNRILNALIVFLLFVIIGMIVKLIPSYADDLTPNVKKVEIISVEPYRSSMLEIKTNDSKVYYVHEFNANYIAKNLKEDYNVFDVEVIKNKYYIYMLKIRPKYELRIKGVAY